MKFPKLTTLQILIPIGLVVISLGWGGTSAYYHYLHYHFQADDFASTEAIYRRKGGVCEELAPRLREVAVMARELAKSASGDFERKKWLDMAHAEDEKADKLDQEAVRLLSHADALGARADALSRLAWRPWRSTSD
jgi:hypothetical protein